MSMVSPAAGNSSVRVLLVEDEEGDAALIRAVLAGSASPAFRVNVVGQLGAALAQLATTSFDAVLLDLSLPDAQGLTVFEQVFKSAPGALILVLGRSGDEALVGEAIKRGAHDYFAKEPIDTGCLLRIWRNVVARRAGQQAQPASEERWRAVGEASSRGIFISDARGACIYTNKVYQTLSGLSFEQNLGRTWSMSIDPGDRLRIVFEWRDAVREDEAFQSEMRFLRADGNLVRIRVYGVAMPEGELPGGRVHVVEELAERRARNTELLAAEDARLEEKKRRQGGRNRVGDAKRSSEQPAKARPV